MEIKKLDNVYLGESDVDKYKQLDFLLKNKKISRRDFIKRVSFLSTGYLLVNNGIIENSAHAFFPFLVFRFIAGQVIKRGVTRSLTRHFVKKVARKTTRKIRGSGKKSTTLSSMGYGTRSMAKTKKINNIKTYANGYESVSDVVDLVELFGKAIWEKNNVYNPASIIVTNYSDNSIEIPKLNLFLKNIGSNNNDFSTKVEHLGLVPPASESIINLGIKDLPSTGFKVLGSNDENSYQSGEILVADNEDMNRFDKDRGMTVEELYKIFLERNANIRN